MLSVGFFGVFLERGELYRPNNSSGCFIKLRSGLTSPESVNQVLDTNYALASEQFFHDDVVRYRYPGLGGLAFFLLFEESAFANYFINDRLGGLAVSHVVADQQQFVESGRVGPYKGDVVDLL